MRTSMGRGGRRESMLNPQDLMGRVRSAAKKAGVRMTPVAGTARDVAAQRIEDARLWAAPKLDQAAHSVEEQIAPVVSAFLTELARRLESTAPKKTRRWPLAALCTGAAIGAIGVAMYRGNAKRWAESVRDTVRGVEQPTTDWSQERTGSMQQGAEQTRRP
ncbi:hypothetical protein Tbis_0060 [Thermobispora bispora DSM 43833]|jgi:hypothetical protein|uniref:DUF3618 domain-containing protein n=2 Tax=Thermobispora bispora TaxID=2006 RepID=D6Y262_THEBD|nr:hypothetical protein Tbis_0060 [Thermobispora bispora DSM 43833]